MEEERRRLLQEALQRLLCGVPRHRYYYHPERHYMRGPGPKTLSKIGEMLRVETEGVAHEPIPDRWLELIQAIENTKLRR
jgi:hypothetical protein